MRRMGCLRSRRCGSALAVFAIEHLGAEGRAQHRGTAALCGHLTSRGLTSRPPCSSSGTLQGLSMTRGCIANCHPGWRWKHPDMCSTTAPAPGSQRVLTGHQDQPPAPLLE